MRKYLRILLPILTTIGLLVANTVPAMAAPTADVTITATPEYLSLTVSDSGTNTWAIGVVAESATVWYSHDNALPDEPQGAAEGKIIVTNDGSIAENIALHSHNFMGGVGWTVGAAIGIDTVKFGAGKTGDANKAAMLVISNAGAEFLHELAAAGHMDTTLYIDTGTFTDGDAKSTTITYTCTKHT